MALWEKLYDSERKIGVVQNLNEKEDQGVYQFSTEQLDEQYV